MERALNLPTKAAAGVGHQEVNVHSTRKDSDVPCSVESVVLVSSSRPKQKRALPLAKSPSPPIAMFEWSNGKAFAVPEDWTLPSSKCDAVWTLWFHGDPSVGISPFRCISQHLPRYIKNSVVYQARPVMKLFVQIARNEGLAADEDEIAALSPQRLQSLLDDVYQHLYDHATDYLDIPLTRNTSYSIFSLHKVITKERPTPHSNARSFTARDCRAMWQLWYHGDDFHAGVGPLRHHKPADVDRRGYSMAKGVMAKLTTAAIAFGLAASPDDLEAMDADELDELYPSALHHLVKHLPPSRQHRALIATVSGLYDLLRKNKPPMG